LKPGGFSKDLVGEKPKSMEELKQRAEKWIQIEEWVRKNKADNQAAKQERDKKDKGKATYGEKSRDSKKTYDRSVRPPRGAYSNYAPLTMPPSRVYKEIMYSELKDRPPPLRSQSKNKDKFCLYHKDHGNYTNECIHLKDAIEKLITHGKFKQFVQKNDEGTSQGRSSSPSRRRGSSPGNRDSDQG
jgi:hypothetical protein